MGVWKISLEEQTATSINGIIFKLTETKPGEYEGVCLNPFWAVFFTLQSTYSLQN
jgi:hypothetical protein